MTITAIDATRHNIPLKILLTGPTGAGKTLSALKLAHGYVGSQNWRKILVIDTEGRRASLYADRYRFRTVGIGAPHTVKKYIDALKYGIENDFDVVILDGASHEWAGKGGLLEKKKSLDDRGGNSYTNWAGITTEHNEFMDMLINYPKNLIVTCRSKEAYVLEENAKGKQVPRKIGLATIQRDDTFEFEFMLAFSIAGNHDYIVTKDNTGLYDGRVEKITEGTGVELREWQATGADLPISEELGGMIEDANAILGAEVSHVNQSLDKLASQMHQGDPNEQNEYRQRNEKAYNMLITYAFESQNDDLKDSLAAIKNNINTSQKAKHELFVDLYKKHLAKKGN